MKSIIKPRVFRLASFIVFCLALLSCSGNEEFSMFTWKRTAISMGIGYRYQKVIFREDLYWWGGNSIRETVTHFNRLELQFGFTFM